MSRRAPHVVQPSPVSARVAFCYKNFAASKGISHIGLGVASTNTSRVLRSVGIWADVWPANSMQDIHNKLSGTQRLSHTEGTHPVSHVVISAPWIQTPDLQKLLMSWPDVHFAVVSHSNVGFLMADPGGIKLLREYVDLTLSHHNFRVAGNCARFTDAWTQMYGTPTQWLPNLYDVSTFKQVGQRVPWQPGNTLRVGVFGATRPLKNMVSSVAAAVEIAHQTRADVEIWMNSDRVEGGSTVPDAVKQLTDRLTNAKLVQCGWQSWPSFRQTVAKMNVLISPSYTESFQMCAADGVAEGVATVGSDAIDWIPEDWKAHADDVNDISRVARRLLHDAHAVVDGQDALKKYVATGLQVWSTYLRV